MAEHFYNSFDAGSTRIDATFAVKAADLLYEIGRDLLQQGHHDLASKWLGRASSSIEPTRDSCAAAESQDLRLNILHTYVRALLATNTNLAGEEAARVLQLLKSEFGHKLAVTVLGIEVLTRDPGSDTETYYNEIVKVIRTVHLIDANHRLIMHYLHHLKTLSLQLALQALKQYIVQRLAPEESCQYTEAAIVTFIWMAASAPSRPVLPSDLDADLTLVRQIWNRDLSPEAAHAVFLLLWREIDKADQDNSRDGLLSWCGLALNNLLGRAGEANIGKVHRKLVFHHMELADLQAANEQLTKMSDLVKQHPLSLSLAYSVAVRCRNEAAGLFLSPA
jgi:Meiosis protein SPO22/ZIP4 like